MSYQNLIRKPDVIHKDLKLVNGQYVTTKGCRIIVPERFVERGLVVLGEVTEVLGIFAIAQDTHYGVSTVNAMFRITPTNSSTIKHNNESYLEFYFEPGSVVFKENQVLRDTQIVYRIFDEFVTKGNVPWYVDYNDFLTLFRSTAKFAGMNFSKSHSVLEMVSAAICRNEKEMTQYYRQSITKADEIHTRPPVTIPLTNITYGATNTTSRLMGAYWNDGMTSSLVNPTERMENVEDLLRR